MNKRRRPQRAAPAAAAQARPRQSAAIPAAATPSLLPSLTDAAGEPGAAGGRQDPHVGRGQLQLLLEVLAGGGLDEHLTTIQAAIRQRHQKLLHVRSHLAIASISVRDRVRLNRSIRPLYLHGQTGTVVGWAGQRVIVELDNPVGRYGTSQIRCPPIGLDVLPRTHDDR